jgi:hypothetical protein
MQWARMYNKIIDSGDSGDSGGPEWLDSILFGVQGQTGQVGNGTIQAFNIHWQSTTRYGAIMRTIN